MVPVPPGVTFRVEQARQDLQGRHFQLQVVNGGSAPVTVSSVRLTSTRLATASTYRGSATVAGGQTVNLTMTMGRADCGTGIGATARLRYRVGDGAEVSSVVHPADHYGSVALFMRRDCAESTLASVDIDKDLSVTGRGASSVLGVGVTFTPRSTGGAVRLGPLDGTTLLKPVQGDNVDEVMQAGSAPRKVMIEIVPNRCDVHVVAEDRTGATMPFHVDSKASGKALFYLRFTEPQRAQIFDFIAARCGFGVQQDPLLAP